MDTAERTAHAWNDVVPLVMGIVGVVGGILFLRWPNAVASFFHSAGKSIFGQRLADRIYSARGAIAAAIGWIAIGSLLIIISIAYIVSYLT
jgi:hypothetical protein